MTAPPVAHPPGVAPRPAVVLPALDPPTGLLPGAPGGHGILGEAAWRLSLPGLADALAAGTDHSRWVGLLDEDAAVRLLDLRPRLRVGLYLGACWVQLEGVLWDEGHAARHDLPAPTRPPGSDTRQALLVEAGAARWSSRWARLVEIRAEIADDSTWLRSLHWSRTIEAMVSRWPDPAGPFAR